MINRYLFILISLFACLDSGFCQDQSLVFLADFNLANQLVEQEGKGVFVDVYADWCQQCKEMDAKTFTDPEVISFFSENFISVKLDGERRGASFARRYRIAGFPSLLFFNSEGKETHRIEGFADSNRLLKAAGVSLKNPKKRASRFREDYRKYKEDPRYLKDYILFCEEIEDFELADKLMDQYAKQISKIDSTEWMDFVMQFVHKENSKIFELLKENKPDFDRLYGKAAVDQIFIDIIIDAELWNMSEPATESLFTKTRSRISKHKLEISDEQLYPAIAYRVFSKEMIFKNDDARSDLAVRILKNHIEEIDDALLFAIVANVAIHQNDEPILIIARDQVDNLIGRQGSMFLHDIKSIILYKLGEMEEAFKQVALAQKYAVENNQKYKSTLKLMKQSGLIE